jgi:hypothetical protein
LGRDAFDDEGGAPFGGERVREMEDVVNLEEPPGPPVIVRAFGVEVEIGLSVHKLRAVVEGVGQAADIVGVSSRGNNADGRDVRGVTGR